MAKQVQDVLRAALQLAAYDGIEADLRRSIDAAFEKMQKEGWID
jgi:hypothetical protein